MTRSSRRTAVGASCAALVLVTAGCGADGDADRTAAQAIPTAPATSAAPPPEPTPGFAAERALVDAYLTAVGGGDFPSAYRLLAPEVTRSVALQEYADAREQRHQVGRDLARFMIRSADQDGERVTVAVQAILSDGTFLDLVLPTGPTEQGLKVLEHPKGI